ncbi:MAG: hypothetical protein A3I13_01640 [Gammaproteobacteria bacterium RIFCSPLOWO2_02_FULL_47_50]|nr:MAG: hypothetical protein A2993_07055 [Gammaproteobacteria bacterium RIFCSPLOWO2_01_FULL_47_190]OGT71263.1 MAG: hypothetical protein A2W76_05400 [Gammaproteobacteria bacterium RIFCSPLOWO2_12_47_11]OGT78821.1 MAG: hypothetical protein A3I13_01640 [Gammaproteobacteria bacterium RIFCSPLOWO2_02_FULL_47_50]OGT84206.1 MAG: hypothetical protein A3G42_02350 [Gammaproteobacteria bacterium RIFCSPLOWO2_12_FULL_47_76]
MFLIISIVFTVLQWICAFFLVIVSIHGPSSLPALTLFWLILIQVILWSGFIIFRRSENRYAAIYLFFLGIVTTVSAPLIYFIAEKYDAYRWNNILSNTKIYDVHDNVLLASDGLPFGIRISFKAEFPYTDYNYITPVLRPQSDRYGTSIGPNDMRVLRYSTSPVLKRDYYFRKGVTYDIVFEMVPGYLIPRHNKITLSGNDEQIKYCLQYPVENTHAMTRKMFEHMITADNADNYLVMLHGTAYGDIYSGYSPEFTRNRYNPADFYNTYKIKNFQECQTHQQK